MATMLAARDSRYAFKIAFDEEFRKQAPGAQLIVELTEHPRTARPSYMDSCADPSNEIMNRPLARPARRWSRWRSPGPGSARAC